MRRTSCCRSWRDEAPRARPSAFVISITPFDAAGEIDWDATRAHFARLRESGIGVYVGGGGSGEGHALLPEEVDRLLQLAAEELRGAVPTRAMGVEPRTAREMIEFGRRVKASGSTPCRCTASTWGTSGCRGPRSSSATSRDVLEQIDVPAVVSTHFSVGYMVPVDLLVQLCDRFDSIIGINCSIGQDFTVPRATARRGRPPRGGARRRADARAVGAGDGRHRVPLVGGQPGPAAREQCGDALRAGDHAGAEDAYGRVLQVFTLLSSRVAVKAMLRALGLPGGLPRLPRMLVAEEHDMDAALAKLREIGIPELEESLAAVAPMSVTGGC